MYRLVCLECGRITRTEEKFLSKCPGCGSKAKYDGLDEYWYDLAEAYGLERIEQSAALVMGLFKLWDTKEYRTLGEFVQSVLASDGNAIELDAIGPELEAIGD